MPIHLLRAQESQKAWGLGFLNYQTLSGRSVSLWLSVHGSCQSLMVERVQEPGAGLGILKTFGFRAFSSHVLRDSK